MILKAFSYNINYILYYSTYHFHSSFISPSNQSTKLIRNYNNTKFLWCLIYSNKKLIKIYLLQLQKNENCLKRTVSVGMCHFEKNPPKVFTQTKKIIISVFLLQYFFLFTFNGRRKLLFVYQDEFNDSSFFILSTLHFFSAWSYFQS